MGGDEDPGEGFPAVREVLAVVDLAVSVAEVQEEAGPAAVGNMRDYQVEKCENPCMM